MTADFEQLPQEIRSDLSAYFRVLLEFGDRYASLTRRAEAKLAKLNERAAPDYNSTREGLIELAKSKGESQSVAEERYPEALYYESYSAELRKLLNANRELGQDEVSECLDGGHFTALRLGNGEITYNPYGLYPTSYMIGFWQRRENEGTARLARYALGKLVVALQSAR